MSNWYSYLSHANEKFPLNIKIYLNTNLNSNLNFFNSHDVKNNFLKK